MTICTNKKNDKRYRVESFGTSSYCNGIAFSISELAETEPAEPAKWLYPNPNARLPVYDDMQSLRSALCVDILGRQGFKLADIDTGRWLDLITGTASKHFHILRLDCGRTPAQYVMVRKEAMNGNLEALVNRYPLAQVMKFKTKPRSAAYLPSLDNTLKINRITTHTAREIQDAIVQEVNNPTGDTINCTEFKNPSTPSNSIRIKNVIPFKSSMYNQAGTMHLVNGPYSRAQVYTDGMAWCGSTASAHFGCFGMFCNSQEVWDRWVATSAYVQLHTYQSSPRPIMFWTDNCNYVLTGGVGADNVGNKIVRLAHLQAGGVNCIKTWGGNDLYFIVVPMLIGNPNHGMHDTVVAFFSASPLTLTNITKAAVPAVVARKPKAKLGVRT